MVLSLSTASSLAVKANREAQQRYKLQYDKTAKLAKFRVGDWVLIYFPQDKTGKSRKLSKHLVPLVVEAETKWKPYRSWEW